MTLEGALLHARRQMLQPRATARAALALHLQLRRGDYREERERECYGFMCWSYVPHMCFWESKEVNYRLLATLHMVNV